MMGHPEAVDMIRRIMPIMGDYADNVADFLRGAEITGIPEDSDRCPVARLFRTLIDNPDITIMVGELDVTISHIADRTIPLTPGVRSFVYNFDRGEFWDLRENLEI